MCDVAKYTEKILRKINNENGLWVGGSNIINIRYADDTVLLAEFASDLQKHRMFCRFKEKGTFCVHGESKGTEH